MIVEYKFKNIPRVAYLIEKEKKKLCSNVNITEIQCLERDKTSNIVTFPKSDCT